MSASAMSPQRFWTPLAQSYVTLSRMGASALLIRTRSLSVGCPVMGRKADVVVARANARAVGVMVAGWGRLGGVLVARWENLGDNVVDVCKRELIVVA